MWHIIIKAVDYSKSFFLLENVFFSQILVGLYICPIWKIVAWVVELWAAKIQLPKTIKSYSEFLNNFRCIFIASEICCFSTSDDEPSVMHWWRLIKIKPYEKKEVACAWSDWKVLAFFCLESLFSMSASEPSFGRPAIPKIHDFSEIKDDKIAQWKLNEAQLFKQLAATAKPCNWLCCMGCAECKYVDLTQLPNMTLRPYHTKLFLNVLFDLTLLPY